MKTFISSLISSIVMVAFLLFISLLITIVPTFVLFILKFVIGYSWTIVLIPTYMVATLCVLIIISMVFSKNLRNKMKDYKQKNIKNNKNEI